jgi:hypothetical protein
MAPKLELQADPLRQTGMHQASKGELNERQLGACYAQCFGMNVVECDQVEASKAESA